MQIDPTPEQQDFVRQVVASGRIERPKDVVQAAMELSVEAYTDHHLAFRDSYIERTSHQRAVPDAVPTKSTARLSDQITLVLRLDPDSAPAAMA